VCLVVVLCISKFSKYCSLLFDTNVSEESIYCDINGKMLNSLNKFLQDSLLPCKKTLLMSEQYTVLILDKVLPYNHTTTNSKSDKSTKMIILFWN
jgi:hypothetical protein